MNDKDKNIILNNSDYSKYLGILKKEDVEPFLKEYLDYLYEQDSYFIEFWLRLIKERYIHFPELMVMFQYPSLEPISFMEELHFDLIGGKNVFQFVESSTSRKLIVQSMVYNSIDGGNKYDYKGKCGKEEIQIRSYVFKPKIFNYFKYYIKNESSLNSFDGINIKYFDSIISVLTILSLYHIPFNHKLLTLILHGNNPNYKTVNEAVEGLATIGNRISESLSNNIKLHWGYDDFVGIFNKYFHTFDRYAKLINEIRYASTIPEIKKLSNIHSSEWNMELIDYSKQIYLKYKLNQDADEGEI